MPVGLFFEDAKGEAGSKAMMMQVSQNSYGVLELKNSASPLGPPPPRLFVGKKYPRLILSAPLAGRERRCAAAPLAKTPASARCRPAASAISSPGGLRRWRAIRA